MESPTMDSGENIAVISGGGEVREMRTESVDDCVGSGELAVKPSEDSVFGVGVRDEHWWWWLKRSGCGTYNGRSIGGGGCCWTSRHGWKEGRKMTIVVCLCDPRCREEQ